MNLNALDAKIPGQNEISENNNGEFHLIDDTEWKSGKPLQKSGIMIVEGSDSPKKIQQLEESLKLGAMNRSALISFVNTDILSHSPIPQPLIVCILTPRP